MSATPGADKYLAHVTGGSVDHHGMLTAPAVALWQRVEAANAKAFDTDPKNASMTIGVSGCLAKLSGCLLQAARLRARAEKFVRDVPPATKEYTGIAGGEIMSDFEGLLLQGRAALDRSTYLIARSMNDQTHSFRRLPKVLENRRDHPDTPAIRSVY